MKIILTAYLILRKMRISYKKHLIFRFLLKKHSQTVLIFESNIFCCIAKNYEEITLSF